MKRKHFILALVAMLGFSFSAFAQETVVVNSFEELKAEVAKRAKVSRASTLRSANVTTPGNWTDTEFGTVQLGNDIVLSETLTVGNTYELTLDLNGHMISPAQGTNNYFINLGSTTIHDESASQTGTINCAIQNGNEEIDYAYLEIQGGTVKSLNAAGAAVTNYGECVIKGGKFFSEYVGLTNYNEMTVDGGANSNVYIEGKTYSIKNSSALDVKNAVIAGTEDSYWDENGTESFTNVTYFNVALNGLGYASLQAAVDAATDGDLIRLFGDIDETATVSINKAVTLDGNGKTLNAAIKISETSGNVSITDLQVAADSEYALQVESSAKVTVTGSGLSGVGAVKAVAGNVTIKDTDLGGSNADVISVASNVIINLNGGRIAASDANNAFIIGGAEGCTGAQLSIMTTDIALGNVKNYTNLNTDANTVKLHKVFERDLYNKGYAIEEKGIALTIYNAVANVGNKNYRTLAEALTAATDGATVKLLWADYKAPVAMVGTVCGKTVTITGTANVDWSKGWFYVGRNGAADGKVIFENANLNSVSNTSAYGINVSGRKNGSADTYNGTVEFKNSTVVLDYLIQKNVMTLDNSTLTVKNGCSLTGRLANETENGELATSTTTLNNGSKLVVIGQNGMNLGYEGYGVLNINANSTFEATQGYGVAANGTMNVNGGTVKIAGTLANAGTVYATGAANLDAKVAGDGWFYMNGVNLDADTKLDGAKVAFINGTNNVVGSTIKNGWFNVGVGSKSEAPLAAAFAAAKGITLGNVTVNVSDNATIYTSSGDAYTGWVGSAYDNTDKEQFDYTLNITSSLARFGYMHVSKDGVLNATGHSTNKYENVDFYVGNFINNGVVTLNGVDAWAMYTKISADHADAVLNITNGTKYEANCTTGNVNDKTFLYYNAGTVNVDKTSSVNIGKATTFVDGAELNIAGNVTSKGAVTGNGTITLTDEAAVYTAPAGLTVGTNIANKMVVYNEGAYKVYNPAAKIGDVFYLTLQEAIDAAVNGDVITFVNNVTEDVTVVQAPDVKITIDGADKTMYGTITVDGKSARYATAGLHIMNVNFDATDGVSYDACVRLGAGNNNTRYTNNVTVESCTFTDDDYSTVAVKSYTGGDWNLQIINCTAEGMHSLAQLANVEQGLVISGNTANTKNGINLNQTATGTIEKNTINVKGYAVRAGVDNKIGCNITLTENTLTTDNSEGDPVIVLRGTVEALNMTKNVVSGNTHIKGTATTVAVDENYWDGKTAPVVAEGSPAINVNSYYSDEACTTLVRNEMGSINAFVSTDRITGDVVSNAKESLVIKVLGADNAVIGTSTLEKTEYINGFNKELTWRINLGADDSDSWVMAWNEGAPSVNNLPAKVVLVVDGKDVATADVKFTANGDGASPVFAAKTNAEGKILSFIACDGEFNLNNAANKLVAAAVAGDNLAILTAGTYKVPTGKDLTITGIVDDVKFDMASHVGIYSSMTFNNVTFEYSSNNDYVGLQHAGTMVYNNCTINGQVFLYGESETFNECTFNQTNSAKYNVWTYSAKDVDFNECIFNSAGKSVLVYNEGVGPTDLTVVDTEFNASVVVEGKAAIEIDTQYMPGQTTITIDDKTTAKGFDNGSVSGSPLWNNKTGDGNDANANNDITVIVGGVPVLQPTYQAQIGDTKYKYLADAVKKVKNGEEIVLLEDYNENIAFTQTKDLSFVLNGNGKTMTGSINITARAGKDAPSTLVIKDFNFKTTETTYDFIKSTETNYYPNNITIEGCTFEGPVGNDGVVAVRLKSANNITIKNCTGTGLHSFLQNTAGWNLTIDNVDVDGAAEGAFALGTVQGVTVKNCDINSSRYGIRLDAQYNNNAVIADNKINAFIPVVVRKASVDGNITFEGNNEFAQTNTDGYWCVIGTDEYKTNGALPTAATAKIEVTLNDSGLDLDGIYGNFGVASIGKATYLTFAAALAAVQDGETIVLTGATGAEKDENGKFVEIEFTKDIEFTITGNAPEYALPIVTFQNATVNIQNAEILIPELDARQSATINVINSTVRDAGGDGIVKSYYNGAINIDATSTVYTMQVTTMGYINVAGTLNATWQTNVYGNGMITLAQGATFNTAGLNLTGEDYSGRDNTDTERVGKPATIVVDGATFIAGKAYSESGADYSYNADKYGLNVGTVDGKFALLDIKKGATVKIYTGDGKTANFGAGATVNVDASTLNVLCRDAEGTATLANAGKVNVSGESNLNIKNFSGNAIAVTDATLKDLQFGGRINAFGTNNISGTSKIGGILSLGYETNPTEQVVVNITGNFNGTNVIVRTNNSVDNLLNVGAADGERTTAHFGQLGASADVNIKNADVTYHYAFIRNEFNVTKSALAIADGGVNTYISGNAKVVLDESTWNLSGFANIGSYGGYNYGNADVTLKNGSTMTATNLGIELQEGYAVNVAIDETSSLTATKLTNQGVMNIAGTVTASTELANTGTINFTSLTAKVVTPTEGIAISHEFDENYKIVYKDGAYSFGDFVAEVNGVYYETIQSALQALTEGATLKFLNDVTVTEAWDCRYTGGLIVVPNVTIDGNDKTLTLTGEVSDPNTCAVFRVVANNATFKNLTIDASEAEKIQRGITASLSITVENCKFIGNGTTSRYGVIYGEGAGNAIGTVEATITGSEFVGNSYGVSDNRNGQDAKSVTVTGNTFTNSKVLLSAAENVTFNGNTVSGASVAITSYSNASNVVVNANDNTLDAAQANQITTNPARQNVQGGFAIPVATSNNVYYLTLPAAIEAVAADAEITLLTNVTGAGAVINKNLTINFGGNTYTVNKTVGSAGTTTLGFQLLKDNNVTLKNGTLTSTDVVEGKEVKMLIQNYANLTLENIDLVDNTDHILYVLSNNSGTTAILGETNITTDAVAFDVYDYSSAGYATPSGTIYTTGVIAGDIEVSGSIAGNLVIYNGTYTMDVNQWCAEGLTAEPDGNGYYKIVTGVTFIDGQFTEYTNTVDMDAEYISYTRNFSTVWTPLYVPFEIPVSQLAEQGFEVAYINGVRRNDTNNDGELDEFEMEVIYIHGGNADGSAKTLRANYPYFIRSKNGVTEMNITLYGATLYAAKDASYDCTTMTEKYVVTGNNRKMTSDVFVKGQYIVSAEGWTSIQTGSYLNPFRFYMTVSSRDGSDTVVPMTYMSIAVRGEEREDGTTLIYDVEADNETVDYIYDLQGRRVLEPQKGGLYIVNGKKVVF